MTYTTANVLVLLSVLTAALATYREWTEFKLQFNKTYSTDDEELFRYAQWRKSKRVIALHNERANRGEHSYWMGINHFSDMSDEEFHKTMLGLDVDLSEEMANTTDMHEDNGQLEFLPRHVDWREKGYVTHVKYQGHCGSCYSFSATGALEGQHFRKTGRLVSLSEQNIVDCTYYNRYNDHGCHGGLMDNAFRYVIANGGVDTEESYPYTARLGRCHFSRQNIGSTARGYHDIMPRGSEHALQRAVAKVGPVSIGVDGRHGLKHYSYGVFDSYYCSSTKLNHGVLTVGYGVDDHSGKQYWVVKNSWGWWWGEGGYFRIVRNEHNMCGIASLASYPIV